MDKQSFAKVTLFAVAQNMGLRADEIKGRKRNYKLSVARGEVVARLHDEGMTFEEIGAFLCGRSAVAAWKAYHARKARMTAHKEAIK